MSSFFRFMNAQPGSVFEAYWLSFRVADGLDVIFWLYNHTGDAFLLTLADTMHTNSANWLNNLPTPHNVNLAQGFREPAVYAQRSGQTGLAVLHRGAVGRHAGQRTVRGVVRPLFGYRKRIRRRLGHRRREHRISVH
jgi:hypothetical protein